MTGSEVKIHVLSNPDKREKPSWRGGEGTHPQCMPNAFLALTSLKMRTLSSGCTCIQENVSRSSYALHAVVSIPELMTPTRPYSPYGYGCKVKRP